MDLTTNERAIVDLVAKQLLATTEGYDAGRVADWKALAKALPFEEFAELCGDEIGEAFLRRIQRNNEVAENCRRRLAGVR